MTEHRGQPSYLDEFRRLERVYESQGMAKVVGLGDRPAVICVDLIRGFTDPAAPMGLEAFGAVVPAARQVLDAARQAGCPVVLVGSGYDEAYREAGAWRLKVTHRGLTHGSEGVDFDPGLGRQSSDWIVYKRYASAFFGTELASRLVSAGVDTVIVTGVATSGCVRASALDALQSGFRVSVVRDAVGDREILPHVANLFDIGTKYGDLVTVDEVRNYFVKLNRGPAAKRI